MATPSQQTNELLQLLQRLQQPAETASVRQETLEFIDKRLQGQRHNRQEFESKAHLRGPLFLEQAQARIGAVQSGFDQYASSLEALRRAVETGEHGTLDNLAAALKETTHELFQALDGYAAFYFAWGEKQSPLVTMIRQAVESYSRSALQTTQAQRILQDMHNHFENTKEKAQVKEEVDAPGDSPTS